MFAASSTTPLSAFNSHQYYHHIMLSQVEQANFYGTQVGDGDDKNDEDDNEEDEEEPQLVRGDTKQTRQCQ
ncbi:hypothetical protein Lal_00031277 [Lupinus albus]|nr:hypothetical protein Lal_00031277 [Lupinus albus]